MARAKPPADPSLADAILAAVRDSGMSVYAVAKGANVSQPALHRFVAGERSIGLDTADRLCRFLGLRLTQIK